MPRPVGKGRRARGPAPALIENLAGRRVCFSKRRKGLFSKAEAFRAAHPGSHLVAVVFSEAGHHFVSSSSSGGAAPPDAFVRLFLDELLRQRGGRQEALDGAEEDPSGASATDSTAICSPGLPDLEDLEEESATASGGPAADAPWLPAPLSPPSCTSPLLFPRPPHLPAASMTLPGPNPSVGGRYPPSIGVEALPRSSANLGFHDQVDDEDEWRHLLGLEQQLLGLRQGLV